MDLVIIIDEVKLMLKDKNIKYLKLRVSSWFVVVELEVEGILSPEKKLNVSVPILCSLLA